MADIPCKKRVAIMGAGGRDFHNFNLLFRNDAQVEVVAFTATQIPFQQGRVYPPSLAGSLYPEGIPIVGEEELPFLIRELGVSEVLFSYSDISHQRVMELASRVLAMGADFHLAAPERSMLSADIPVISVCAVRTGCGKSPVTRFLCRMLQDMGRRPVVIRHPMAYGRLDIRAVEHFQTLKDLDAFQCTLEEREEYEPLIEMGVPLFAGVDYEKILSAAQKEGDTLIWDGGNNDFSFFRPDMEIVLTDPCRAGHEVSYFPGMVNLLRADIVVLSKFDDARDADVRAVKENIRRYNPDAQLVKGRLAIKVDDPGLIKGKRVVVVEDGPTLTHGGMEFGAGSVAARTFEAREVVDPRPYASGSLAEVYQKYPHLKLVVPAMGYSEEQVDDLRNTLEAVPADLVLCATPADLETVLKLSKPVARVSYEFEEVGGGVLRKTVAALLGKEHRSLTA